MNTDARMLYKELTHDILNVAFEVHNVLGCGFLEKVHENAMVSEFKKRGIRAANQILMKVCYKDEEVGHYYADLVVDDKIILEIKTVDRLTKVHQAQLLNYLKATHYRVGLLLNFANTRLEYKRLIL